MKKYLSSFILAAAMSMSIPSLVINAQTQTSRTVPGSDDDEIVRIQTNVVQLDLRATDRKGRIRSIRRDDIKIYVDNRQQELISFTNEAIKHYNVLVDTSSSMRGKKFERAVEAIKVLVRAGTPEQVFSIYTFADDLRFLGDFSSSESEMVRKRLGSINACGNTALYDATAQILEKSKHDLKQSSLIIFTEGEDTASHTSAERLQDRLGVEINLTYLIVLNNQMLYRDERTFPDDGEAKIAGAKFQKIYQSVLLLPTNREELQEITASIPAEARNIVRMAFAPADRADEARRHSLRIEHSDSRVNLFYRNTYRINGGY